MKTAFRLVSEAARCRHENRLVIKAGAGRRESLNRIAGKVPVEPALIAIAADHEARKAVFLKLIDCEVDNLPIGPDKIRVPHCRKVRGVVAVNLKVSIWRAGKHEIHRSSLKIANIGRVAAGPYRHFAASA